MCFRFCHFLLKYDLILFSEIFQFSLKILTVAPQFLSQRIFLTPAYPSELLFYFLSLLTSQSHFSRWNSAFSIAPYCLPIPAALGAHDPSSCWWYSVSKESSACTQICSVLVGSRCEVFSLSGHWMPELKIDFHTLILRNDYLRF